MIHLILGGARSGKSSFALAQVEQYVAKGSSCLFIATAQGFDDEMQSRIARHRLEREVSDLPWQTIECPLDLNTCLTQHAKVGQVILVDCLTLWLTNQLLSEELQGDKLQGGELQDSESNWHEVKAELLNTLSTLQGDVLLVSNEVGCGVVPADPLSRRFVDEAGWLHQAIAEIADKVTLVTAGLPLSLKAGGS
ncbi:bifunctional adenosylcobinamide kinase/adenosylcobinamide-phosphate guanylyltransferase [Shewanella sp. Isolate11]|uniref:bifunctional adenosylcobinamide kinase/adenosylcobinamide-phosphate guanylyltransferase n=1 Tax=Shewanella sp. Isolate11 TaxID=2908530 RepID=UPI001EFEC955|nr:bifunctional adenosylcobinamide kinase/adenosylcobinamide-phosphate guanylyltransferase [Shewanella sp. Isolate11]MCG9697604.1 bifunctional adenosylcobinamide kinase/adenosylcobinamide-phosphate guanylyltransferase [Shewanella sp. Isolate11]